MEKLGVYLALVGLLAGSPAISLAYKAAPLVDFNQT